MRTRKVTALLLVAALLAGGTTAFAAQDAVEITPRWENVSRVSPELSFSASLAACTGRVTGLPGTTQITLTMTLERLPSGGGSVAVNTWSSTTYADAATLTKTYNVLTGYNYRLTVTASVTRNGTTEVVSASTTQYCT